MTKEMFFAFKKAESWKEQSSTATCCEVEWRARSLDMMTCSGTEAGWLNELVTTESKSHLIVLGFDMAVYFFMVREVPDYGQGCGLRGRGMGGDRIMYRITLLYLSKNSVALVRATVTIGVKMTSVPMIQGRHAKAPNAVTVDASLRQWG